MSEPPPCLQLERANDVLDSRGGGPKSLGQPLTSLGRRDQLGREHCQAPANGALMLASPLERRRVDRDRPDGSLIVEHRTDCEIASQTEPGGDEPVSHAEPLEMIVDLVRD